MIYTEALRELLQIVSQPGVPAEMVRSAARLSGRLDLCLVTTKTCSVAGQGVQLEPSDAFLDYLSAVRAREWLTAQTLERRLLGTHTATLPRRRYHPAAAADAYSDRALG
jgi:hypothetical protein